jgi:tRNA(adenine34) deaminase
MQSALKEAITAFEKGEIPVGAVVARDGVIIGRGSNERLIRSLPFAHAEMKALAEAGEFLGSWRFDRCTLYVTLEPCLMCAGAVLQTRTSRVVFGARDPKAGAAGSLYDVLRDRRMPHRCRVTGGVLAAECAAILKKFFLTRRINNAPPVTASSGLE